MTIQKIIDAYYHKDIESMTVRDAKLAFDTVFESITEDCVEHDFVCPDWDEAFGLWVGV